MTEIVSDADDRLGPWSEAALRQTFGRRVRAKVNQAELDREDGLHRKSDSTIRREAEQAVRREIERSVNVENARRREQGKPLVWLAVM